jgi:hypothetical protein
MDDGGPSSSPASVSNIRSRMRLSSSSRCGDGGVASSCRASSRSRISRSSCGSAMGRRSYPGNHSAVIAGLAEREPRGFLYEPRLLRRQQRAVHTAVRTARLLLRHPPAQYPAQAIGWPTPRSIRRGASCAMPGRREARLPSSRASRWFPSGARTSGPWLVTGVASWTCSCRWPWWPSDHRTR